MRLITETSYDFELVESKANGVGIVGIYSSAELKNNNLRVYSKDILDREVSKVQEKIENKTSSFLT